MAKLAVVEDVPQGEPKLQRPRIVVALGKQGTGKTFFLRYYIERGAKDRKRPLKLVDADPHNSTLLKHYKGTFSPESSAIEDRRVYLEHAIRTLHLSTADGNPYDLLVDIGGGDLLVPKLARDVAFTETVEAIGIELITFYMIHPSPEGLEYFQTLDDAGFRPERLGLVFNGGLVHGDRKPARAFEAVLEAPLIRTLLERGAKPLFMPALANDTVEAIGDLHVPAFADALPKLDFFHQPRLKIWLAEKMEKEIAQYLIEWGWLV